MCMLIQRVPAFSEHAFLSLQNSPHQVQNKNVAATFFLNDLVAVH